MSASADNPGKDRALAIALQYETGSREAPRVTAKGRGLVAEAIVSMAREHDVVIEANPQLAEALAQVELDNTIPVELFEAVAEVIGFVIRVNRQRSWKA